MPLAAVLALAGGALLGLGAVLDWSGVDYSSRVDRQIASACAAASVAAAFWLLGRPRAVLAAVLALTAAVVAADMAVVNLLDVARHRHEYAALPDASVGVGLWLLVPGACLTLAAGLTPLFARLRARTSRTS